MRARIGKLGIVAALLGAAAIGNAAHDSDAEAAEPNTVTLQAEGGPIHVAPFDSPEFAGPNRSIIRCRHAIVGNIEYLGATDMATPEGEDFSEYVRQRLIAEMKDRGLDGLTLEGGAITLNGQLDRIRFDMLPTWWVIGIRLESSNGRALGLDLLYEFFGEPEDPDNIKLTCAEVQRGFMPALDSAIRAFVDLPDFPALFAASAGGVHADDVRKRITAISRELGAEVGTFIETATHPDLIQLSGHDGLIEADDSWNHDALTEAVRKARQTAWGPGKEVPDDIIEREVASNEEQYKPLHDPESVTPGINASLVVYDLQSHRYAIVIRVGS